MIREIVFFVVLELAAVGTLIFSLRAINKQQKTMREKKNERKDR